MRKREGAEREGGVSTVLSISPFSVYFFSLSLPPFSFLRGRVKKGVGEGDGRGGNRSRRVERGEREREREQEEEEEEEREKE